MDLATLIGIVLGFALVIGSMALGGSVTTFFNVPGLLIVVGGTFAATFIMEKLGNVLSAFKVLMNVFFDRGGGPLEELVPVIGELAAKARKEGLVSLEGENIPDDFMARGVRLGVDGLSPEIVTATLEAELSAVKRRHARGQAIFKFMGSTAPSLGMVGTLIGLVQMLKTLDDPAAIGPAMAVALLTTLYGAILAFLLFIPFSEKLGKRSAEESERKSLAIAGVESILRGDNNLVIQSKLEAFLPPSARGRDES